MDFGLAFSFLFKDPDWFKKIAIIGLVGLIPIIGQFVYLGWAFEIARRVIRSDFQPLPELDFGEQLGKGFQVWLIYLVYAIPIIIVVIPLAVVDSLGTNSGGDMQNVVAVLSVCCSAIIFLVWVIHGICGSSRHRQICRQRQSRRRFSVCRSICPGAQCPGGFPDGAAGLFHRRVYCSTRSHLVHHWRDLLTAVYAQAVIFHLTGQAYRPGAALTVCLN
jgi:hypothetical protein